MKLQDCFFFFLFALLPNTEICKGSFDRGMADDPWDLGYGMAHRGGQRDSRVWGTDKTHSRIQSLVSQESDRSESLQVRCPSIRQQRSGNLACRGISQRLGCVLPRPQRCTNGSIAESRLPAVCMSVRGMSHGVLLLLSQPQSGRGHGSESASPAECASLPMVDSVSQPWRVTIEAILGLPSTSLHVTLPPRDSVYVRSTG